MKVAAVEPDVIVDVNLRGREALAIGLLFLFSLCACKTLTEVLLEFGETLDVDISKLVVHLSQIRMFLQLR